MNGIKAIGGKELRKHLSGERLTRGHSIEAKCYDCMGGYLDGKVDCKLMECPLYPWMPYKGVTTVSEE